MNPPEDKDRDKDKDPKWSDLPLIAWVVMAGIAYGAGHALFDALGII